MKKIINQAPIVRYRAFVNEDFFPDFWNRTFSAESNMISKQIERAVQYPFEARTVVAFSAHIG